MSAARRVALLLGLWCCFAPAAAAARLCMTGGECRDHECGQPVASSAVARTFHLVAGAKHVLGIVGAGETAIHCDRDATLQLRVANLPRRGSVHIRLTDPAQRTWELQAQEDVTLRLPKATYEIVIESPHFRTIRRTVRAGNRPETLIAALEPLPVLSGRVFERGTATGIGGAVISTDVDTTTIADASGFFTIEADPDRWPSTIAVSAGGFAENVVAPPRARRTATLDDVFLSRGGTVTVEIVHPAPSEVTGIELQKLDAGAMAGTPLTGAVIAGEPLHAKFENVAPGRYLVLAKGPGPCERSGEVLELAQAEQKSVKLRITPLRLRFRAAMAGKPLAGADVREFEWDLGVSPRRIAGVVVDRRSGAPVPNAAVSLKVRGEVSFSARTRGDAQGRFQFLPVPHGRHTITAAAPTHLQAEMSYTFAAPEESRDMTVRLEGGTVVRLRVTDAAGAPVVGAVAMQYKGLVQTRLSATDVAGIAEILVPEGETRDVYVVPRDGTFGIARITSKSPEASVRLHRATSRIEIRAESESHQAIPNVSVVVRYNRHLLPREVVRELGRMQGARTASGADGRIVFDHMPAGLYEFWPAGSAAEMRGLLAGMGPQAPVTINVTPGDHVAVLTFAAVRP